MSTLIREDGIWYVETDLVREDGTKVIVPIPSGNLQNTISSPAFPKTIVNWVKANLTAQDYLKWGAAQITGAYVSAIALAANEANPLSQSATINLAVAVSLGVNLAFGISNYLEPTIDAAQSALMSLNPLAGTPAVSLLATILQKVLLEALPVFNSGGNPGNDVSELDPFNPSNGNPFGGATTARWDPLILDLDGDDIETTSISSGAYFDFDNNGFAEKSGWVKSDDGVLVMDRNGDGIINDGQELFGDQTLLSNGQRATDGFQALADLDTSDIYSIMVA